MEHPFKGQGPLLFLLVPFFVGVFLGLAAGSSWPGVAALLLILAIPVVVFHLGPLAIASVLMALCGVLAAGRAPLVEPAAVAPFLEKEIVLRATVDEAKPGDNGWSGIASDAVVSGMEGPASLRLPRVRFVVRKQDAPVPLPSEIRATGRLYPIRSFGNPGEFPRELGAMAQGVQYAFSTEMDRAVFLPPGESDNGAAAFFARMRARTRTWVLRHAGTSDGALYLLSLTTGDVPPSSHPMVTLLRRTGLAHLLAISGINVAVFFIVHAFLLRCVLWIPGRRRGTPDLNKVCALLSLPVCWGYVLLAGAPVPALRSAGMISVAVLLRQVLGVRGAGAAWSILLFVTLAADPFQIFSPSFLLSYGATFFLIASCGRDPNEHARGPAFRAVRWVKEALVASSVAFLGTLPFSAAIFGAVPAGAIVWNLLFGPILGVGGVLGAFAAVVGGVCSLDVLGFPVALAAGVMTRTLGLLSRLSGSGWGYVPVPPAGVLAPFVATLSAACGAIILRRRGHPAWIAVCAAAAAFAAWIHLPYAALPVDRLELTALNVGKGAAHVVSFPGGKHMVIDCGSALHGDAGSRIVGPFLRGQGIRTIDVLVLTHPHEDHYGGAHAVLEAFDVGEIWIPAGVPPDAFGPAVGARSSLVRPKTAGDSYSAGGATVVVRASNEGTEEANENCLVMEIRDRGLSVWLPGDVETGPACWGRDSPDDARFRVLFLPHHGSPHADPAGWLCAARPLAAVKQNWNCYEKENLLPSNRYFRLENGAVIVCPEGEGVCVSQAAGLSVLRRLWRIPESGTREADCGIIHLGHGNVEAARPDPRS